MRGGANQDALVPFYSSHPLIPERASARREGQHPAMRLGRMRGVVIVGYTTQAISVSLTGCIDDYFASGTPTRGHWDRFEPIHG